VQQLIFGRGHLDDPVAEYHPSVKAVDQQVANPQIAHLLNNALFIQLMDGVAHLLTQCSELQRMIISTMQCPLDGIEQVFRFAWLEQVIIDPGAERFNRRAQRAVAGQHHYFGRIGEATRCVEHSKTVNFCHAQIGEDDIIPAVILRLEISTCGFAIGHSSDVIASAFQNAPQ
jgi:hypothetical protein